MPIDVFGPMHSSDEYAKSTDAQLVRRYQLYCRLGLYFTHFIDR